MTLNMTAENSKCKIINGVSEAPSDSIDLSNTNNLLINISEQLNKLINVTSSNLTPTPRQRYYDEVRTSVSTEYTSEDIFDFLSQNAKNITVLNDGPGTIYVKYSNNRTNYSNEFILYEGEAKKYTNVHTLKIRTSLTGVKYRVTEFEIWKQKNIDYKAGRGYIRNANVVTGNVDPATAYATVNTHAIFAAMYRNATTGYIKNRDSVATLYCWISSDGTEFGQVPNGKGLNIEYFTVDPNSAINLDGWDVNSIKISANQNNVDYEIAVG